MKLGSIGVQLNFSIKDNSTSVDLTNAESVKLIIVKSNYRRERDCVVVNAAAGNVKYITVANDFPTIGLYQLALKVVFSETSIHESNTVGINVENGL